MKAGTVRGALHRLALPLFGCYSYRARYAGELDRSGLLFWIALWLPVDFCASWFFEGLSWWWLAGGPGSALLLWWLPLPLAAALVALQISRATLSLALGSLGFLGVNLGFLSSALLALQLWALAMNVWLVLLYLRTPKREIGAGEKDATKEMVALEG